MQTGNHTLFIWGKFKLLYNKSRDNILLRIFSRIICVPSLLGDELTLELSGLLSRNSLMIPVAPAVLPMPENVSVVGERLMPIIDSNRIPTAGTLNLSDFVPCNVMPRVYETVKQYATGPSSTILVLAKSSSMMIAMQR